MDNAFLIQLALSAAAVGVMVAIAAWAGIVKPVPPLDEARARFLLSEEFPDRRIEAVWVATDGAGALARSGGLALVICKLGDGFVMRQIPWAQATAATFRDGRLTINLADISAPKAVIAFAQWPPENLATGKDLAA